jgi:hypothetical protein
MAPFGTVVSEPEEILFDVDEPRILSGVGTENYKINIKINTKLPNFLAVEGKPNLFVLQRNEKVVLQMFGN